jgi:hypothetical protein
MLGRSVSKSWDPVFEPLEALMFARVFLFRVLVSVNGMLSEFLEEVGWWRRGVRGLTMGFHVNVTTISTKHINLFIIQ